MSRRHRAAAASAVVAVLGLLAAGASPARASSTVTLTFGPGSLTVTEPGSANLGSTTLTTGGATIAGHLGTTTVTDTRGSVAGWTVTISATNLSDGATPTPHTITANHMKAYVATADGPTVTSGIVVPATAYATLATALTLSTSGQTFVTATATGSNVVTYNPTLSVTVDTTAIAGTYSGSITQTVS